MRGCPILSIRILWGVACLLLVSCGSSRPGRVELLDASRFDTVLNGKQVGLYTLSNKHGMTAQITDYGARVVALWVPAADGSFKDVVWGYSSIADYLAPDADAYAGPIVGRYGNRIGAGRLALEGREYQLTVNDNGVNHLHGGAGGWSTKVWEMVSVSRDSLSLRLHSPDGEEGYPGNVDIVVTYSVKEDNALRIEYLATTDAPTVLNPTSHCYFNLNGTTAVGIAGHRLKINSDSYTPTDSLLIPTGKIEPVEGTPFDFRMAKEIGCDIDADFTPIRYGKGYDHNFVLDKSASVAAEVYEPGTGILMEVMTDQPGIQFYSGNFMCGGRMGKRGDRLEYRSGFALETQNFPDAPNHVNFPCAVLKPGEKYCQVCVYKFSTLRE